MSICEISNNEINNSLLTGYSNVRSQEMRPDKGRKVDEEVG